MIASAPSQPSAASAARTLGTIPPAIAPASMSASASPAVRRVEPAAVGVAHAVDVGQQDELAGADPGRDPGRHVVGVDVADDALLVAGERRHDRHLARRRGASRGGRAGARRRGRRAPFRGPARRRAARRRRPTGRPRRRRGRAAPATSSLFTTPRRTAAATSSEAASVTRRPPSNVRRDAEPVEPLGDPPAAAVDEDDRPLAGDRGDLAQHLALVGDRRPAELDDERRLRSCRVLRVLDHVGLGQVAAERLARPVAEAEVEPDEDLRARPSPRGPRHGRRRPVRRPAPSNTRWPAIAIRSRSGSSVAGRAGRAPRPRRSTARRPRGPPRRPAGRSRPRRRSGPSSGRGRGPPP